MCENGPGAEAGNDLPKMSATIKSVMKRLSDAMYHLRRFFNLAGSLLRIAYGRVSTKEQNVVRQLLKFRELGIEERFVFVDKQSCKNFDHPHY